MGNRLTIVDIYKYKVTRFLLTEECANFWTSFTNYYQNPEILDFAVNQLKESDDQLKIDYYKSISRAKLFKGILLPGYFISPKTLINLNSIQIRDDDVIIASYPRSGNHWLSEAVYFITVSGNPVEIIMNGLLLSKLAKYEIKLSFWESSNLLEF